VGADVIERWAERYLPKPASKANPSFPTAAIVDVDGFLSIMCDRSPLDYRAAGGDKLNHLAASLVCETAKTVQKIIIATGREEIGRRVLEDWLRRHNIPFDVILMRPIGDRRDGTTVKREYLEDILTQFNPVLAIDNDLATIKMYSSYGIPTWLAKS
jgi:hypothetical protein